VEHIKVAVISFTPNMLDLLLAKDRGFYSAQGLEVEWVPLAGEKGIRGLLEGKVDFSIQIAAALKLVMTENAGLKIALIIHRDPPHWMMGRPGFTIEQLRGKTVGSGGRGSDSALLVEAWLEKAGLEPGVDVSVSYHGAQPSWARGWFRMTDDVPMAIPLEREILEARGWAPLVELCTLFPGLLNHGLVVTEQTITNRPEVINKMVKAHREVVRYIRDSPEEVIGFIQKQWQVDEEAASKSYAYLSLVFCAELQAEDLQPVLSATAQKLGQTPLDPKAVMDSRFVLED
jgi:ABC-type nitrate/sulfonate/bicarbonate transport system substrate-binding protein